MENENSALKSDYGKALLGQKVALEKVVKLETELKAVKSETAATVKMEPKNEDLIMKADMKSFD